MTYVCHIETADEFGQSRTAIELGRIAGIPPPKQKPGKDNRTKAAVHSCRSATRATETRPMISLNLGRLSV